MQERQLRIASMALTLLLAALICGAARAATFLSGFSETNLPRPDGAATWNEAVGMTFSESGRMFVWERGGRVWIVDNASPVTQPLLDLNDEVLSWGDHGMLGFALDPAFEQNGYVYALYTVDPYHLDNCDSPAVGPVQCVAGYNAATTWIPNDPSSPGYFKGFIGRLARFRAIMPAGDTDYRRASQIDYSSRRVLIGETSHTLPKSTGIPFMYDSHGVGTLIFGEDGTLLVSAGDGASYSTRDVGSASETYYQKALEDGIIQPKENVGALRSQLIDSLAGKILRIDPVTGDGLPSNPYYDSSAPRAARSRVWARGLRNPFRMTLRPESGSHSPQDGLPGVIYLGDVGENAWEEVNVATAAGQNFGWPLYEGLLPHAGYQADAANVPNLDAPNPLFGGACTLQYFRFVDLIRQDTLNTPSFPNPCNAAQQIPVTAYPVLHTRPTIDYSHGSATSRWAAYALDGSALAQPVGTTAPDGTTVTGNQFQGNASTGGVWFNGTGFPAAYSSAYFHVDYGGQWIKSFTYDASDRLRGVADFASGVGGVVAVGSDPHHDGLYYIAWTAYLRKVSYAPPGGNPPVAVAAATPFYGSSPLTVNFSSAGSNDPDGGALTYAWNFGDGTNSTAANPQHTYTVAGGAPTNFTATLTVRDPQGLQAQRTVLVSVNNTPPTAHITSPVDGTLYSVTGGGINVNLTAAISDAQTAAGSLTCTWQQVLYHNNHEHSNPFINGCSTQVSLSPVGCDGQQYSYGFRLWVYDPQGLSATDEVRMYPDCAAADITPPTVPAGLTATALSSGRIALTWSASSDGTGTGVAGYHVLRGGVQVATVTGTSFTDTGLAPDTAYSYAVSAFDNATPANESLPSPTVGTRTRVADIAPPSVPTGLLATPVSTSQVALSWNLSSDNGGGSVAGYHVLRGGVQVAAVTGNAFNDTGLTANTLYSYTVTAFDDAAPPNESAPSAAASARTLSTGTTAVLRINAGGSAYTDSLGQAWAADSGFNTGTATTWTSPIGNTVDDTLYQTERFDWSSAPELQYSFTVPNGTYLVRLYFAENWVTAPGQRTFNVDIEGVRRFSALDIFAEAGSARAALLKAVSVTVTDGQLNIAFGHVVENPLVNAIEVLNVAADTTPPSVPTGVTATPLGTSQIALSWNASTDTGGVVAGYRVRRGGVQVATVAGTTYTDTGLTANTVYSYTVSAFDNASPANESAQSSPAVSARTLAAVPDTTPPSVPTGATATPLSASQIRVGWSASTDSGGGVVAGYHVFRGALQVATVTATTFTDSGLTANTLYSYTVTAFDNASPANESNPSSPSVSARTLVPDTAPPSVPTGLVATALSTTQIGLTWNTSTDSGGGVVAGYHVYRGGVQVAAVTTASFTDSGLTANTSYSYTVSAFDNASPVNESLQSSPPVSARTLNTPPTVLRVNAGGGAYTDSLGQVWAADNGFNTGNTTTWTGAIASTVDDALYQTERFDWSSAPELQYAFTVPNGTYVVKLHFAENWVTAAGQRLFHVDIEGVRRFTSLDVFAEAGGIRTALVKTVNVTVSDGQLNILLTHQVENPLINAIEILSTSGDTTPPSVPTGLTATPLSTSQVGLSWNASTDSGGGVVAGYRVYRGGVQVATVTAASFTDAGLTANTLYSYTISAFDNASPANESNQSSPAVSARTLAPVPDTTPPNVPTGLAATPLSPSQIRLNWNASTDSGGGVVAGYHVFRGGVQVATVTATTFTDSGLTADTLYSYTATAFDNASPANESNQSSPAISARTLAPDTTPPSVPTGLVATPQGATQISLTWNASTDSGGGVVAGYHVFRGGVQVAAVTATSFTNTGLTANTLYSYTVTAFDNATPANESNQSSPAVSARTATSGTILRINTGGGAFTDSLGQVWAADSGFNTGSVITWTNAIANTVDDALYQTERFDWSTAPELQYGFTVPNGNYLVRLHFSENYVTAVGQRLFHVDIEGVRRFTSLDIFAEAGARAALVKSVNATVADGQLNILFTHQVENPLIDAIEVIPQ